LDFDQASNIKGRHGRGPSSSLRGAQATKQSCILVLR